MFDNNDTIGSNSTAGWATHVLSCTVLEVTLSAASCVCGACIRLYGSEVIKRQHVMCVGCVLGCTSHQWAARHVCGPCIRLYGTEVIKRQHVMCVGCVLSCTVLEVTSQQQVVCVGCVLRCTSHHTTASRVCTCRKLTYKLQLSPHVPNEVKQCADTGIGMHAMHSERR